VVKPKEVKRMKPILIVENEEIMRESLRDWLTTNGYQVETVEDGDTALATISQREFGLLILDLRLPGKDGIEVLRQARTKSPQLKGIIITAYPSVQTAVEALKEGAVEYLSKPFDLNDLERVIEEHLGPVQVEIRPTEAAVKDKVKEKAVPTEQITLTIDGQKVTASRDMTILEAAESIGVIIPTLCQHKKLSPFGACRLCMVEISKRKQTRLVTSCAYQVEDGLVVNTESERVIRIRKMLLEMMWARSPGVQEIRDYGIKYGIDLYKFDVEPTFCIDCGLCVRYCAEVKKKHAIGFIGRGTERQVMFFPEIASKECAQCGECYSICPTGVMPSIYGLAQLPHFASSDKTLQY
jgi:DNA-binding response OmpR family regulator/NAD-dependent dihydropyrimidine dehydrogenase PreA subunit